MPNCFWVHERTTRTECLGYWLIGWFKPFDLREPRVSCCKGQIRPFIFSAMDDVKGPDQVLSYWLWACSTLINVKRMNTLFLTVKFTSFSVYVRVKLAALVWVQGFSMPFSIQLLVSFRAHYNFFLLLSLMQKDRKNVIVLFILLCIFLLLKRITILY